VLPNSPAEKGGIEVGDIILKFEGQAINLSADLPHKVGVIPPGDDAQLEIVRAGEAMKLSLVIGALPNEKKLASKFSQAPQGALQNNPLNVELAELSSAQKERLGLAGGVIVKRLLDGVGARSGLLPADVITMLSGVEVQSVSHLLELIKQAPKTKPIPMRIVRRGSPLFIPIKLEGH